MITVCIGCSESKTIASIEEVETAIFQLVNQMREAKGLQALERTSYLDGLATEYAGNQFSEESSQSSDIRFLLTNSWHVTYDGGNPQLTTDTAEEQISYCLEQQDMKDAIYKTEARATGVGIAVTGGVIYYVQVFDVVNTSGGDDQPIRLSENSEAADPSWERLKEFLEQDKTDEIDYQIGQFICGDFAETLHNNAEQAGIRAAYVFVNFPEGPGHALNAFSVEGVTVYVDVIGADKVAYIEEGKSYGVIALDVVTEFSYSYFETYAERVEQYLDDHEAYNDEFQDCSDEVDNYNAVGSIPPDGMTKEEWHTSLLAWQAELSDWYNDLAVEKEALGISESYWSPTGSLVGVDDPTVVDYYVHW